MGKSLVLLFVLGVFSATSASAQNARDAQGKSTWLTALYLRPVEPTTSSRENWPLIPAQLLEGTATDSVLTSKGPIPIRQVRKGSIVYYREPGSQVVSTWEVRIVQRKARRVDAADLATMKNGFYSPDNRVAWKY